MPDCAALLHQLGLPWPCDNSLTPLFYGSHQSLDQCFFLPYLHSSTSAFLLQYAGAPIADDEVVKYEIYTDGSGGSDSKHIGGPPAWSFVVLAYTNSGRCKVEGYLSSPAPGLSDAYVSPSGPAEFYAALWCVLWLLQAPSRFRSVPVHIFTDNIMVVNAAAGGVRYPSAGRTCEGATQSVTIVVGPCARTRRTPTK